MLFDEHARRERFGVVAWQHRHARLGDDRASVELGRDEMNRAAVLGQAGGERTLVGV